MGILECNKVLEPPVKLVINLEKSRYTAGDEVKGEIFISIRETFGCTKLKLNLRSEQFTQFCKEEKNPELIFSSIYLSTSKSRCNSEMIEKKHYFDDVSSFNDKNLYCPITENKIIHNSKILIAEFPKYRLLPGEYKYPISFIIPDHIPGSFEYCDNYYYIYSRCILEVGLYTASLKNTIKALYLIIVNQPVKFLQVINEKIDVQKLKNILLISKGTALLKVMIQKENFLSSQMMTINCELDNRNCSLNANLITISLIQNIKIKFKNKITKIITRRITSMNFPYFLSKKKLSYFKLEIPILDYNNPTRSYYENYKNFHYFIEKDSFHKLQGSIKSDLIDCSYVLKVEVHYKSTISSFSSNVEIPIAIHIPDIKTYSRQIVGSCLPCEILQ